MARSPCSERSPFVRSRFMRCSNIIEKVERPLFRDCLVDKDGKMLSPVSVDVLDDIGPARSRSTPIYIANIFNIGHKSVSFCSDVSVSPSLSTASWGGSSGHDDHARTCTYTSVRRLNRPPGPAESPYKFALGIGVLHRRGVHQHGRRGLLELESGSQPENRRDPPSKLRPIGWVGVFPGLRTRQKSRGEGFSD